MESKIKLYAASLMAITKMDYLDGKTNVPCWEHVPHIIQSVSIELAAKEAERLVFQKWKKEEGYFYHSAAITPITTQMYAFVQQFSSLGFFNGVDTSKEETQVFVFDSSVRTSDYDSSSFEESH